MNGAIYLQPILLDAVQLMGIVVLAFAMPVINRVVEKVETKFHLQSNATARASIDGIVDNAVSYGEKFADAEVTKVGPIETGNPLVASAANFVLSHGADELAQLNHDPQHVIQLVQAAMGAQAAKR